MKNTIKILIILIVSFSLHAEGQSKSHKGDKSGLPSIPKSAEIKWGPEMKIKKSILNEIIGTDESGYYALSYEKGDLTLEHYNNNLNRDISIELELKEENKKKEFEKLIYFNDQLCLFTSFDNSKLKKNFLFLQTVNKKTLMPNNDLQNLCEINYKSKHNDGEFHFDVSRDSSKLIIEYETPYERKENEQVGLMMLDKNLKELWRKKVTLPYTDELFDLKHFKADNEGNAYIMGKVYKEGPSERKKDKPNYNYHIFAFRNNGDKMQEYIAELKDKFITHLMFSIADNGDIICAGLFSPKARFSVRGCFYMAIDPATEKILKSASKDFDINFITQDMSDLNEKSAKKKEAKGQEQELYDYELDKLILRSDGGAVLIAEQRSSEQETTTSYPAGSNSFGSPSVFNRPQRSSRMVYYYEDILVVNIDPAGNIAWEQIIPKRQRSVNDDGLYSSYSLSIQGDKLNFIYNDHSDNLHPVKKGRYEYFEPAGKNAIIVAATISSEGIVTREALVNNKELDVVTRPKVCRQIASDQMLIFGQKKNTHQFGIITFN